MPEDWRLRVDFGEEAGARELLTDFKARDLEHDLKNSFRDRVVVSRDGETVFCYAHTQEQASSVSQVVEALRARHGWTLRTELQRWHPIAERWESPDEALPETPAQREHEHAERIEDEREESREQGFPMFEVRVKCDSHSEATALARRLEAEGMPTVQRWQFVVVGATDQDSASALAERIRGEAPPGTEVMAEGSVQEVAQDAPFATPFSPFSVFGGLGG
jgi:hypothetical protein